MHNVSQSWVDNQENQLRKETLLRLSIFNQQVVPLHSEIDIWDTLNANKIACLELMAVHELDGRNTAKFHIKKSNLNFDNFHFKSNTPFWIRCYDGEGTMVYEEYSDDIGGIINNVELITFSPEYQSDVLEIYYACFGSQIELTNKDIQELNYNAHCSIINEDLPYHKITLKTIQKSFPLDYEVVMYAEVGYNDIQYIPLGCGYYYLDRNSYANDGFVQQYNFVDVISSMTHKFIYGRTSETNTYKVLVERALDNTVFANPITYPSFPARCVPNYDISNIPTTSTTNLPNERTCAEVLQLIAQASGLTLYVDEHNIIKFVKPETYTPYISDTNDMWLLEKPITTATEKVGKLSVSSSRLKVASTGNQGSFTPIIGMNHIELNGIYNITSPTSTLGVDVITYNYIMKDYSASVSQTISASEFEYRVKAQQVYVINADSQSNVSLELEIASQPDFTTVSNHCLYWLEKNQCQTLQVRYDSKYFLLDKIGSALKEYSDIVVEDLSATYGNGCKGTIKGRVMQERLLPPIIQNVENGGITIVNPNADYVELVMVLNDTEISQYGYSFKANETKTIWDNDLQNAYDEWVADGYGRKTDFFVYFEDGSGQEFAYLDSKNVIVFGGK